MDDTTVLRELNEQFIESFRQGKWELLDPILSPGFAYLDGNTGDVIDRETYAKTMQASDAAPRLSIDQVVVHIDGDSAMVSSRSSLTGERYSRYVDSYHRRDGRWYCYHATVWRLQA